VRQLAGPQAGRAASAPATAAKIATPPTKKR
jgi:hypothetical protein